MHKKLLVVDDAGADLPRASAELSLKLDCSRLRGTAKLMARCTDRQKLVRSGDR
jgi:hypothetical protein